MDRGRILRWVLWLAPGIAAAVIVLALSATHAFKSLDLASIDARFSIRGTEHPNDVVVVGIDTTTFNQLLPDQFPYPRRLDGQVVTNLAHAGAKVIAFDLQFAHPSDRADDTALINAVRGAGNVVLGTVFVGRNGSTPIFAWPGSPGFAYSRAVAGEAQFPTDSDGAFRRMEAQVLGLTTFPIAAAQLAVGHRISFPGGPHATAPIDFAGPPGTVREIPFSHVLNGQFNPAGVRGKVVVIGAVSSDLQDLHTTATGPLMSGAEVNANAIETALRGFPLSDGPGWLNTALVLLLSFVAPLLSLRFAPLAVACLTGASILLLALIAQLAFDGGTIIGFVYPAVAGVLGAAGTFALQSRRVRMLEAAMPSRTADYFVSYRRGQSELAANMLKSGLTRKFGERAVFMDVGGIDSGDRWPRRLEEALSRCKAMLVVIGPSWLEATSSDGSRRLDSPGDWVRREVETGLANEDTAVVPVLHDGAEMPDPERLPDSLKPLTDCQAVRLTGDNAVASQMDKWIEELDRSVYAARVRRSQRAAEQRTAEERTAEDRAPAG